MEDNQQRLWVLWTKKMSGEATSNEMVELETLLADPINQGIDFELLKKLWYRPLEKNESPDIDKNWHSLTQTIFPEKSHLFVTTVSNEVNRVGFSRKKVWWLAAASVIVAVCAVFGFLYQHANKSILPANLSATKEALPNSVVSRNGSKTSVTLPEGTKVWLNAGSQIFYDNDFVDNRQVYLTGEAYFDVTHNADKPFVIHAANINIRVLGTAFNVKAYTDDEQVETSLLRGSVEISTTDDPDRKILLRPNEKISILKSKKITDSTGQKNGTLKNNFKEELYAIDRINLDKKDSTAEDIAWMSDKIIFKSEPFTQLAKRMERWYGVDILFTGESCRKIKFTGELDNQNIVQALEALAFSCNYKFQYSINKNSITIQPK